MSRLGKKNLCYVDIEDELVRATDARLYLITWNGRQNEELAVNSQRVAGSIGDDHDLSFDEKDIPISTLVQGENEFSTYSTTSGHGIEVQWPGIVLKVIYDTETAIHEETPALSITSAAYPNPFNANTTIRYTLPHEFPVSLRIYNIQGQLIQTLVHTRQEAVFMT